MNQNFKKHLEASYTRAFEECARTGHKVGDLDVIFNSIAMGTFAELIVRECANICLTENVSNIDMNTLHESGKFTIQDLSTKSCGENLAKHIEKHFGVES